MPIATRSAIAGRVTRVDDAGVLMGAPAIAGRGVRHRLAGPLLITSNDGAPIAGALGVAEALARRDGVHVHVLGAASEQAAVTAARARGAQYILIGLEPVGAPARAATLDAAARMARAGTVPVLAVPPPTESLPRRALVHVDLGQESVHAAGVVGPLLGGGGTLVVADLDVRSVALFRDPAEAARELARNFDLVAVGIPESDSFEQEPGGSAAVGMVRGAKGCVLVAPPPVALTDDAA